MLAMEISAPEREAILGGAPVRLRFDHNQMRQSELYYQQTTARRLGYLGIVEQAIAGTYIGLGAIAYGARASAQMAEGKGPEPMWRFDRDTGYEELRACMNTLLDGVTESLPKPQKKTEAAQP